MKRTVIGFVLLAVLFFGGFISSRAMISRHERIAGMLRQAEAAAMEGELETASALSRQARAAWEEGRSFSAVFADHGPMEEIDDAFSRLETYCAAGWEVEFSALCAELTQKLQAMGDAHGLDLWNIL